MPKYTCSWPHWSTQTRSHKQPQWLSSWSSPWLIRDKRHPTGMCTQWIHQQLAGLVLRAAVLRLQSPLLLTSGHELLLYRPLHTSSHALRYHPSRYTHTWLPGHLTQLLVSPAWSLLAITHSCWVLAPWTHKPSGHGLASGSGTYTPTKIHACRAVSPPQESNYEV